MRQEKTALPPSSHISVDSYAILNKSIFLGERILSKNQIVRVILILEPPNAKFLVEDINTKFRFLVFEDEISFISHSCPKK